MPVTERSAPAAGTRAQQTLSGWGRVRASAAEVIRPADPDEVQRAAALPAAQAGGLIARGAGRSYGDAAQNSGGVVLDMTGLDRVLGVDRERRLISAQAGATIAELLVALAPHRLTLPVLPGTRYVTVGGAIASDIHGKNHHRDGGLARFVTAISLCTPAHGLLELTPESDPDLFYATLGGMGLTGVIVQATLRAREQHSPWLAVDAQRTCDLQETIEVLAGPESHRYSVAWLDLLGRGSRLGRAIIERGDEIEPPATARARALDARRGGYAKALVREPAITVPARFPGALLRAGGVRAFNALHWSAGPRRRSVRRRAPLPYFFPLDRFGEWHRLYGSQGLIQYQFVVPEGCQEVVIRCCELLASRRVPVFLAVFKRMGAQFGGPLSFPLAGWTLAIDLPAGAAGLARSLDELDELVAACGGRVYLSKDVRLRPDLLGEMYPQLATFAVTRSRVDPQGVLRSDLSRRLGLSGSLA